MSSQDQNTVECPLFALSNGPLLSVTMSNGGARFDVTDV